MRLGTRASCICNTHQHNEFPYGPMSLFNIIFHFVSVPMAHIHIHNTHTLRRRHRTQIPLYACHYSLIRSKESRARDQPLRSNSIDENHLVVIVVVGYCYCALHDKYGILSVYRILWLENHRSKHSTVFHLGAKFVLHLACAIYSFRLNHRANGFPVRPASSTEKKIHSKESDIGCNFI